ncbi:hypothetical protein LUD75_18870 [Epilithonimonas sp. JDS]|uniref:reprolysin-like metallopeptidase n=1 Tax=Epilithonimonas sp. JDS TaxID=2902797 RepID=UPI001E5B9491|nr:hypothetical protein [Epilithonimonas sp. JDS]MCD9856794.1 hypothetical protein [Epilithonimonas sp. JDS]
MSRTRIVKGIYTKISAKGHSMYSNESIITTAGKQITETGIKKGVTYGNPRMIPIYVDDRCLITFRPKNNWNGNNYGFDWVRVGDTKIPGDVYYRDIMGKYGSVYASQGGVMKKDKNEFIKLMKKFNPHTFFVKDKNGKKKGINYCVPWLSLYPQNIIKQIKQNDGSIKATVAKSTYNNTTATLRTIIKIDKKPEKLELEYDVKFFKITNPAFPLSVGTHEIEMTISCLKEFGADQGIKVVATYKNSKGVLEKSLAGKLNVLKNIDRYKVQIVFVQVWTDIGNKVRKGQPTGREAELKKYMNQALINPNFDKTLTLKCNSDVDPITKQTHNRKTNFNRIANIINNPNGASDKWIENSLGDDLYQYLNNELDKKYGNKYQNVYKVYFINENNPYISGIGRTMVDPKLKTILVFASGFRDSTIAHEVFHSMGLYHSFDNNSDFTFEINKTENIMDYSDLIGTPVISTYHWQWKTLQSRSEKE